MNTLNIRLTLPEHLEPEEAETSEYDDEFDDVRSILRDICFSLHQVGGVAFNVTAGSPIAVSVRRDLCVTMEQLAGVLRGLSRGADTSLDLYEQAIEEILKFTVKNENEVLVERKPLIGSSPTVPIGLLVQRRALLDMLSELATCFLVGARARCPVRAQHHWFASWAAELEDAIARARHDEAPCLSRLASGRST